jgi:serine/threonine protein kinase
MSSNLIGKIINNRYRIEEYLDSGGMGVVFRVWDIQGNVPLAMKMMRIDQFDDPDLLKVFKREAAALKQLPHPNIIPFYGLCETKDYICILEKFVDGPDFLENPNLKDFIKTKKNKRLSIDETLVILKSISAALGFAHEHGVVHCDVKPANVMIDRGGSIYLGDFGIARHADSTITTMLGGAGTLPYMAPEQIKLERVSAATDIYSLGVLTYEILTGKRPFLGDEDSTRHVGNDKNERIRFAHLNLQPPDPSSVNPAISRELSTVLLKALEKDPNARFDRCWDFFEAVCNAVGCNPNYVPDRIDIPKSNGTPVPPPISITRKSNPIYFIVGSVCVVAILLVFIFQKAKPSSLPFPENPSPTLVLNTLIPSSPVSDNSVPAISAPPTSDPATSAPATDIPATETPKEPSASNFSSCVSTCLADHSNNQSNFSEATTKVYFQYNYENFPSGAHVTRQWSNEDQEWVRYECEWDGPSSGVFDNSLREPEGLRSGMWNYKLSVENKVILQASFFVKGDHSFWAPAGLITGRCK